MSNRIDPNTGPFAATPLRTWAGQGTGRPCHLCRRPILAQEIEYEVDLATGKRLLFHFACQQAWEEAGRPCSTGG